MGVIIPQVVTSDRATSAQVIDGSLKFDGGQYLSRTPSSTGDRQTWTWSFWTKRTKFGGTEALFGAYTDANNRFYPNFNTDNKIAAFGKTGGTTKINVLTDSVFRETGWYHVLVVLDTTESAASDKLKYYINGNIQDTTVTTTPTDDIYFNLASVEHRIGDLDGTVEYDGFMSQCYFIDGQALAPSEFGFTDPLTNTWKPKKYTGTFGTNGFWLPMDGSAPIGQDQSGQGNDWTPVNFGGTVELNSPLVTGTRPILNVTQGGAQAGVGVFGQNVGYAVTVYNDGGGNKYYIDGVKQATLTGLIRGATYTFDTSDSTVSSHPFRFSATSNGSHGGGSEYTNGVAAITGAATTITVPYNAPETLYYYCTSHSGMGADITGITTNEKLADQYASNCTLAFVGIGSTTPVDVSASIACTTSTKTLGINGTPTAEVSNFYGPSPRLIGNSSWFTLATTDDVEMGTGDYTLETYAYVHSFPVQYYYIFATAGSNTTGFAAWGLENNGQIRVTYYDGSNRPGVESVAGTVSTGRWYHFAFSRTSGTQHIFVDGVCVARGTWSENVNSSPDIRWGTNPAAPSSEYGDVSLSDFRIYKGVGKYTASAVGEQAFVVPSAVPDILPDTPSGVSGGSKLTKITDGGVSFDASGYNLTLASDTDFAFGTGDFTIECYAYLRGYSNGPYLFDFRDDGSDTGTTNRVVMYVDSSAGTVRFWLNGSARITDSQVRLNSWNHYALVRSGSTTTLYVNGVSEGTYSDSTNYSGAPVVIGQRQGTESQSWDGFISNVRVIKGTALYTKNFVPPSAPLTNVTNTKLLTCQENQFKILTDTTDATGGNSIQSTNNSGITSTTGNRTDSNSSSLVLAVPFNGTTDDICDEIGSNTAKAATLTNSPSSENIGHFYGKSYKFTGADGQRINYAASADFNFGTGAFTIEGWYYHLEKTSANKDRRYFVHNETAWESSRWIVYCGYTGNPNRALFYTYDTYVANGNAPHLIGKTIFTVGNWYHIAVTRSSNTFRLFVNGRLEDQADDSNSVGNSTIDIEVGGASQQTDRTLFGHIQDLRIYKGVAKYTASFVPPRVPTYDSAVTPSSNIVGLAGGESLPTNFNPFITDINTVRGQESGYATLNPLIGNDGLTNVTLSNGNLTFANSDTTYRRYVPSNISMPLNTGKYYFEGVYTKSPDANNEIYDSFGLIDTSKVGVGTFGPSNVTGIWVYRRNGYKNNQDAGNNNPGELFGDSWGVGDVIGISYDSDNGIVSGYKNGVKQGDIATDVSVEVSFLVAGYRSCIAELNFGQKPFKFPPPDGFQPLNAANVRPETIIARPDQFVGVTTYSGDNTDPKQINLGMAPDLIWVKARNQTNWNWLTDTVRGAPNKLYTNSTNAEDTAPQYGQADSLNDFGFVAGGGTDSGDSVSDSNKTGTDYVVWSWKAGGNKNTFNVDDVGYATAAAAGLTGGDITPSGASVGTKQGFSIIQYAGTDNASAKTIPHGLLQKPDFMIVKQLTDSSTAWTIYHSSLGATKYLEFDDGAEGTATGPWNDTEPTSSLFTVGSSYNNTNRVSRNFVSYHWHNVPGLQKFGSYFGNGNADGPFLELGFKPAIVWVKRSSSSTGEWRIWDTTRDPINFCDNKLYANKADVETGSSDTNEIDIYSNGFKLRSSVSEGNASGETFIYCAWAEAPSIDLFGGGANAR